MGERLLCKQEVTGSIPVGSMEGKRWKSRVLEVPKKQISNLLAAWGTSICSAWMLRATMPRIVLRLALVDGFGSARLRDAHMA